MEYAELWSFVGAIAVIAVGLSLIAPLRRLASRSPGSSLLPARLYSFIYRAIWAAEKYANKAVNEFQVKLDGADKKALAGRIYDMLPGVVVIWGIPLPTMLVKSVITREKFAVLVESIYRETSEFIDAHQSYMRQTLTSLVPPPNESPAPLSPSTFEPEMQDSGAMVAQPAVN